jgi:hypothetical protein
MEFKDFDLSKVGTEVLLVGGVWAGEGNTYLMLFPEFDEPQPEDAMYAFHMDIIEWKKMLRQSDVVEKEVLEKAENGKLHKAIARKSQRVIEQGISWNVWRRDNYRCRYCGNAHVPLTVDHVVLWEEGGPAIEANLVAACRKCNKKRGNMQYGDWIKSDYYKKVAAGISEDTLKVNAVLLLTLDKIPRVINKAKRK